METPMSAPKVLLVDDEPQITRLVARKLQQAGIETVIGQDGEEGFQLALEHGVDLIVSDLQMPYMSGIEMAMALRQEPSMARVPIIILTGSASREANQKAEAAGVTDIFRKQDIGELVQFMSRFSTRYRELTGRVLYVEDNKAQLMAMKSLLRNWGLLVDAYSNVIATGVYL